MDKTTHRSLPPVVRLVICLCVTMPLLAGDHHGAGAQENEMRFEAECFASVCLAVGEGRITPSTPERFEAFMATADSTFQVLLSGGGGNLDAGKALGRAIRARGLGTVVAGLSADGSFRENDEAQCVSACAYAFLGGTTREVPEGSRIGFHQFSLAGVRAPRLQESQLQSLLSYSNEAAAALVAYIIEMEVDARLFTIAGATPAEEMFYPSREELDQYDVVTPRGFDHFRLEPYGDGIIATSRRLEPTRYRDLATDLTAFCDNGAPRLLLAAGPDNGISEQMSFLGAGIRFPAGSHGDFEVDAGRVSTWSASSPSSDAGYIQFEMTDAEARAITAADDMLVYFEASGAEGGTYAASIDLDAMDGRMLAAAFRFCI